MAACLCAGEGGAGRGGRMRCLARRAPMPSARPKRVERLLGGMCIQCSGWVARGKRWDCLRSWREIEKVGKFDEDRLLGWRSLTRHFTLGSHRSFRGPRDSWRCEHNAKCHVVAASRAGGFDGFSNFSPVKLLDRFQGKQYGSGACGIVKECFWGGTVLLQAAIQRKVASK